MRAYAMLLGLALTTGYGYAAQIAVSSVGTGRLELAAAKAATVDGREPVWYGGVLDPVTIEAKADSPTKTAAARRLLLDRTGAPCPRPARYTAVS